MFQFFKKKDDKEEFISFVKNSKDFSEDEKGKILSSFECSRVQVIFSLTLYLVLWSVCAAFFDAFFASRGIFVFAQGGSWLAGVLPALTFIIINAFLKYFFIYFYTQRKIEISKRIILIGVIPLFGSLFIAISLLKKEKKFIQAFKKFLKYRKKKRIEDLGNILKK